MKRLFCMLLSAMIITMLPAVTLAETSEESVIRELKEHCYINPNGGNKVHLDMNCPGVNPRYLPLTEVEYTEDIANKYHYCPVCCGIIESAYTSEGEDLPFSEKDSIASSVLLNHYGTDDMWTILRHMSQAIFINQTDWHSPRNQPSPKDSARINAIMEMIIEEHK